VFFYLYHILLLLGVLSGAQEEIQPVPQGASTLAFVFDVTGSMYDDLVQVIEGASKILETSLSRPKRPLHNFALVPFHDPEIGPVTITTDPKKFQNELRELYVQGGGDCPEMSIGAIKIALEISLPGSYIYVFTDARSKDYKLTHEVLQLIQQKQSQVVFVLTGDCDDRSHIGYKVYEEIASTSSGQVFHLDKKQVNEVLKWVEEAVQSSKVHLLSTDHYNPSSNTWQIPFDPSLKEVTVALSGPAPGIEIRNPQGKLIGTKDGLTELLHIPNSAKVFNLKDPAPGMWSIKTISEGRHSVRITGLSTIDFRAGFSRKHTLDFKMTSSRPVQGIPTFILLNTTGLSRPARADRLELLSITGGVMKTLPIRYYPERLPYSIWNITEFVPPNEAFFLRVTGYDRDGYLFQRVSSVSFSSIVPGAPKVIMPSTTPGYYLQKGGLSCYVDSLIPYTVRFAREGERLGVDQLFSESSNASWEITEVSLKDEGFYDCVAISSAGTGRARTFLDPPPAVTVLSNATASPGSVALLTCVVASTVRYNLTWQRGGVDIRPDARLRLTTNLSLEILRVTPDDGGWYGCVAANEGGVSSSRIYLNVQAPPLVSVNPQNQTFSAGEEVWIRCSAKGYPTPTIVSSQHIILLCSRHRMTPEGALVIRNTVRKDAGAYSCLASNVAGTNTQTALLSYIESPQVTVPQSRMLTGLGQTVIMECTVTGIPQPEVLWYKGKNEHSLAHSNSLIHCWYFFCYLTVFILLKIILLILAAPQFTRQPSDVAADIGSNVTLTCHAQGHPEPRITWRREDNTLLFSNPLSLRLGYVLQFAQNHFGKIQTKARVTITGLVSPVIALSPAEVSVIEEQQVTLPCVLLAGNPLPQRHWIHENTLVSLNTCPYVSIRRDGSLHIERVSVQDGGEYTCVAENVAGSSNRTTTVHIYVMPTIQHGPQVFSTIEGTPISLPCHARGVPKPDITWAKRGEMLDLNGGLFSLEEDGSLHIASPSGEESGEFVCTATNPAGYSSRKVQLTTGSGELVEMSVKLGEDVTLPCEVQNTHTHKYKLYLYTYKHTYIHKYIHTCIYSQNVVCCCVIFTVPPSILAGPRVMKVQVEHSVDLPCVAQGVPEPSVSWQKDGTTIVPDGTRYRFSPDGTLTIQKVTLTNEGVYTCTASNIAGQDKANIQLIVQGEGCCLGSCELDERVANQRIAFPCPAKGMPQPVIKWFRNGQELTGNEPGMSILEDGTLLILASVSPLDNGEYTCTAVNDAGSTEKKYQLKVNVPPDVRDKGLPANVSVVMNQPTSLLCDVTGTPPPVITWYKDGVPVCNCNRLFAHSAICSHYSCKAINIAGNTDKDFYLDVLVPPTIIGSGGSRDLSAILNQEISLVCKVKGVPFPTIQWYKDRKPVFLADPNIEVSDQGQVLKIKSARLGDQARYQCSVSNSAGKQSRDFNLSIYVPPSIKGGNVTAEVTALLDNSVTLECEARGVPLPAITWYKNGVTILSSRQAQYLEHGQYLKITRVQVSDSGHYTCKVTSVAGTAEKAYELDVYVPPSITGGSDGPVEKKVVVSKSLTLECEAGGHPPPSLTWLKDGSPVNAGNNLQVMEQGRKIQILSAVPSDAGRYVCVATSSAGEMEIKYDVNVLVPPTVDGADESTDATVTINSLLELECHATGTPTPTITWLKDGKPVRQGEGVKIAVNGRRLIISRAQVSDTALFQCVASNEAGEQERDFKVAVHGNRQDLFYSFCFACAYLHVAQFVFESIEVMCPDTLDLAVYNLQLIHKVELLHFCNLLVISLALAVPPSIRSTGPAERSVILHNPMSLQCVATGVPAPSITWLKDGRPVDTTQGLIKSAGKVLHIKEARLEDAGKYTCVATNAAGEAQQHIRLNVHETVNQTILAGYQIQLQCKATGRPVPAITWYKDSRPLTSAAGVRILSRGQVLEIDRAQVSDSGIYKCVAVSVAGKAELTHMPPNIMGEEVNSTVLIGRLVELHCQSDAIPPPTLSWRKDGRPLYRKPGLTVSEDGTMLRLQDTGRYTCEAANIAGKTEKNYNLNVWVRPSISPSEHGSGEVMVVRGGNVTLQCEVDGVPRPAVTWLKDGRPLGAVAGAQVLSEGRLLYIKDAQVAHTGRYTCIAVNIAGQADNKYDVTQKKFHTEKKILLTIFSVSTNFKTGQFNPEHNSRVKKLSNGSKPLILCIKNNFQRVFVVPASISGHTHRTENVSVVVRNPVALTCEASGIPLPVITWLKDNRPILSLYRYVVFAGGRSLRLMHAAVEDAGRFTCIVSNSAGEDRKNFDLDVLVPPSIVNKGGVQDVKVKEGQNITLTCEATGNPVPEITWLKDGQLVTGEPRLQVMSHGRFLHINDVQVADTGRYSCLASNSAGDRSIHFNLNVLVSPTIAGSGPEGSSEEVTVTLNSPTSLVCEAQSYPPAIITWLKDGIPFESSRNVRVLPGRTLQILNAQEEDAGRYTCVATNEAGETLKNYEVKVYIPPVISKDVAGEGFFPREIKIKVNNTLTLECEAQAIPTPTLQWYKDGQTDGRVTMTANGRIVQIKQAQVSDTGRYTCVASNIAGEDEKDFDVNIQVPPSFQDSTSGSAGEAKDVILNNPISLYCETNAVPPPTLTWYKDGRLLASNDRVLILPGGRVLQIPRAQAEDSGRYTCVAVNDAGEDSIQYDVRVLLPPSIRGADRDVPEEVVVLVNKTTRLECHADGSPPPKISWLKDRQPLNPDRTHTLLSNGRTLQILNAQVTDTGRYVCVADNVAGSAEKYFNLNVHVPPSILGANVENATVVVNNFISLSCEATGFPPPTLSWLKDSSVHPRSQPNAFRFCHRQRGANANAVLYLLAVYWRHRMEALPPRGRVNKQHKSNYLPPSIRDSSGDSPVVISVRVGNSVTLECQSNAVPPPTIMWYKNGRLLTETANLRIHNEGQILELKGTEVCVCNSESLEMHILSGGGKLQIARSQLSDSGTYTCLASNIEGKARKSYHLTIQVPPSIVGSELPGEVSVLLNDSIQLVCRAEGTPPPTIQWLKDGQVPDGSTLTVTAAHTSDGGKYTCVATNKAGEEDKVFNLNVYVPPEIQGNRDVAEGLTAVLDSAVNIECVASGSPPPHLNWLKNGLPLPVSAHVRLLSAGQVLRIARVQVSDEGTYTCVASNRAGVDNKHYSLQVYVPPSLDGAGTTDDVMLVRGSMVALVCISDGTPTPTVSWLKDGAALSLDTHITLLNHNSTLKIPSIQIKHTGRYTCVAQNQAGEARRHFNLKVLDPPRINGSGFPTEVSVVVNHVLELVCEVEGIPVPTVNWVKDGRPLLQTDGLRLLRGGEVLRISSAQDTGRYSCLATSSAGDDDKEFLVRVHVPPNIAGETGVQDVSVIQNRQVTLECKSDAVPPPTLSWLKDGIPLKVYTQVPFLKKTECVRAGKALHHAEQKYFRTWIEIHGICFSWIYARIYLHRYKFTPDGSLHIHSAQMTDTGRYLCMATNQAGTQRKRVDLQVYGELPPSIADGSTNVTVTVNIQTTLSCEATGIPKPSLTWSKDGRPINTDHNQNMYRLLSSGSLVVIAPTVEDTALYECVVTNEAGQENRAIQLTVQVPPSIADEATELIVNRLSPVVISCTASGVPEPVLHWSKDGVRLAKEGEGYKTLPSGPLEIASAELSHSGHYSCSAKNAAGSAHRHVQLTVQVINSSTKSYDVAVDGSVTLQCQSEGYPTPSVIWHKDGQPLTESVRQRVLSSGSLHIVFTQPGDTGRYTCTAANVAGSSSVEMSLTVLIPPIIRAGEPELWVMQNTQALLSCVAEGVPQPTINWEREGVPLTDSVGQHTILPSGELIIDTTQPEDAGTYTCVATNSVGQDSWTITLSVHTHPAFTELLGDVALNMGERLLLACGATGIPTPKITWAFNNNIIPGTEIFFIIYSFYDHVNGHSELVIEHVSKDDAGTYSCVAENHMGSIKSVGFVYVKEPPIIDGDVHSNHIEPLGGNAILNCEVRGDPLPTIQWSKNGVNIQISNRIRQLDNGSLAIYGTVNEDAGNYVCVATNDAGVVERTVTLTLQSSPIFTVEPVDTVVDSGSTVVLNCQAQGEPTPVIEWASQGRPLLSNDRITILANGSLRISSAQKEDTAEYACIARNLMGSALVRMTLTVRGGPQKARGSVIGNINDVEFGIAILNATISTSPSGGKVVRATITNVPRSLGPAMRKLISLLNPIYWTTAQELGEAFNGYSLTDGLFRRETQVEFATGEILRMTHVARGLDTDGALLLDIVVNGHILQLPSNADISLKVEYDYTEDYIQTGPGQLYALSTRMFSVDRVSVPYSWNHTISYDPSRGKMPYLVQTLHTSAINAQYHPLDEMLDFTIHATIAKGIVIICGLFFYVFLNRCDEDENECVEGNPCSHACHNAIGTYYCSCPRGLTISADGRTCQDIDECSLGGHICHDGQDCENTIGSYRCVMRCGRGFRRTADGLSCSDIDECRDGTHLCRYNQICENTRGSYHCTCPRGYRSQGVGQPCLDINECEHVPMPCAYQCANSPGSYKCLCPPGRHLLGDGKSCAGLERFYHSYTGTGGRFRLRSTPSRSRRAATNCPHGFRAQRDKCLDINECEQRDTCQHECMNTPGSHKCLCPSGYRLMTNGKTCQDIDECLEQNIQCGSNRMCFNMRGSYQCIDTPCPPNYQREPATGFCLKNCPPNDLECALSPYALEYKLLSLPFGIAANQDLIRLVAYTQDGVMHPRTSFLVVDEDTTLPFALRDENLKGVLFTTRPLREPHTYRMKVKALSYSTNGGIEYQTTFIVYIAVSAYPY
uniref:Hemicentin 1 n=1 Tax=Astyanax mexicanus TaxID=7994 RepID=A0A8B9H3J1_ASTMX